jgi:tetratricopeptide (TPR) repeat protein
MILVTRIQDRNMIRPISLDSRQRCTHCLRIAMLIAFVSLIAGCTLPTQLKAPSPIPAADPNVTQQRIERAKTYLSDGLKKYDSGNNDDAIKSFLLALDSGQITVAEQVNARKHIAFIHCLSARIANCKEEFEKIIALDPKFDLSAAEAGHPAWGPVYRVARMEIELRKGGQPSPAPPPAKVVPPGAKLIADAMQDYDEADYNMAIKNFQDALKESLSDADQITAHKFIAFSYCLSNRQAQCRTEFETIFKLNANFELAPAEAGHPFWGPSFRAAKAKYKSASAKKQ